jgi:methyl-accepting chemotaxis protein
VPPRRTYSVAAHAPFAAATAEIASGISESASAAAQLRKSMEQIATGAEEASGASQQSLTAVTNIAAGIVQAKEKLNLACGKPKRFRSFWVS